IPLRIDRVVTQPLAQAFAQFADVAFDDRFVDVFSKKPVHRVENLALGDAPSLVHHEILQYAPLAAWQGQRLPFHLRVAPIEEHAQVTRLGALIHCVPLRTPADRLDPRQELADLARLAQDIIHARREQLEPFLQRPLLVHPDDSSSGSPPYLPRQRVSLAAIAEQERLDSHDVTLGNRLDPLVEIHWAEACRGYALPVEPGRKPIRHGFALVDDYDHCCPPNQIDRLRYLRT